MITILKGVCIMLSLMIVVMILGHGQPTMFDLFCDKLYQAPGQ
jgi:hypothetical protein